MPSSRPNGGELYTCFLCPQEFKKTGVEQFRKREFDKFESVKYHFKKWHDKWYRPKAHLFYASSYQPYEVQVRSAYGIIQNSGDSRYRCRFCPEATFSDPKKAVEHSKTKHDQNEAAYCEICDKTFPATKDGRKTFRSHMAKHFDPDKLMTTCEICGKKHTKRYITRHKIKEHYDIYVVQNQELEALKIDRLKNPEKYVNKVCINPVTGAKLPVIRNTGSNDIHKRIRYLEENYGQEIEVEEYKVPRLRAAGLTQHEIHSNVDQILSDVRNFMA